MRIARVIAGVMLVMMLAAMLPGCGPRTTVHSATFDAYETVQGERVETWVDLPEDSPFAQQYRREPTGAAFVKLEDGTRIKADCPVLDLEQGALVNVQQNADGSWVVVGTR